MKKICLIGSAPSSMALAPFDDPSFTIWACSPGAYPSLKRCDAFFEIHPWEPHKPWYSKDYIAWMAGLNKPIYMIRSVPEIPCSVAYPKEEMVDKFGPFFMTSSLSWMFALAIHEGATEIALYGVDMSAAEEWIYQRSGCHYFIHLAKTMGIKITVPNESDLLRPPPLYGFCEETPEWGKMAARKAELSARRDDSIRREAQAHDERVFLQGAIDDIDYNLKTWIADRQAIDMVYFHPKPEIVQQAVAQNATTETVAQPVIVTEIPIRDTLTVAETVAVTEPKPKRKYVRKANGAWKPAKKTTRKYNKKPKISPAALAV